MLSEKDIAALVDGAQTVSAIHRAIADPKSAAALLNQIKDAAEAVAKQHQQLAAKVAQFETEKKKTNKDFDDRHAELSKREAKMVDLQKLEREGQRQFEAAREIQRSIEPTHLTLAKRETAVKEREAGTDQREKELDTRATSLAAREARIAEQELDYKRRMEGLRALAG